LNAATKRCEKCRDFLLYNDEQPRGLCWRCECESVRGELQAIINRGVGPPDRFVELVTFCHQREPRYGWHDVLLEARRACDRSRRLDLAQVLDRAANTELKDFQLADWRREFPEARVMTKPPAPQPQVNPQIASGPVPAWKKDVDETVKAWQGLGKPPTGESGERVPVHLRDEIWVFVNSGDGPKNRD